MDELALQAEMARGVKPRFIAQPLTQFVVGEQGRNASGELSRVMKWNEQTVAAMLDELAHRGRVAGHEGAAAGERFAQRP